MALEDIILTVLCGLTVGGFFIMPYIDYCLRWWVKLSQEHRKRNAEDRPNG